MPQGTSYALARGIREALARSSSLGGGLQLKEVHAASDGTRKLVFTATEGPARGLAVESVLIPMAAGATERRRFTLCVSSQVRTLLQSSLSSVDAACLAREVA